MRQMCPHHLTFGRVSTHRYHDPSFSKGIGLKVGRDPSHGDGMLQPRRFTIATHLGSSGSDLSGDPPIRKATLELMSCAHAFSSAPSGTRPSVT
jgi:hypothetical protein